MDTQKEVVLGGRTFVAVSVAEMNFPQYAWISAASERIGLGQELVEKLNPIIENALKTETPLTPDEAEAFIRGLTNRAYEGPYLEFLAGVLVEKGREWDEEGAAETIAILRKVKGVENIQTVVLVLGEAVFDFFLAALGSLKIFLRSSLPEEVKVRVQEAGIRAVQQYDTVSLRSSSKNLPDGTPSDMTPSPTVPG